MYWPRSGDFLFCSLTEWVASTIRITMWEHFLYALYVDISGLMIFFRDQCLRELCGWGIPMLRSWAVMFLCTTWGQENEKSERTVSRVVGWESLPPEIGEQKFYVLLKESTAKPFVLEWWTYCGLQLTHLKIATLTQSLTVSRARDILLQSCRKSSSISLYG